MTYRNNVENSQPVYLERSDDEKKANARLLAAQAEKQEEENKRSKRFYALKFQIPWFVIGFVTGLVVGWLLPT